MAKTGVYRRSFPEEVARVLGVKGGTEVGISQAMHISDKENSVSKGTKERHSTV